MADDKPVSPISPVNRLDGLTNDELAGLHYQMNTIPSALTMELLKEIIRERHARLDPPALK